MSRAGTGGASRAEQLGTGEVRSSRRKPCTRASRKYGSHHCSPPGLYALIASMRKAVVAPLISVYGWLNRHRAFEVPLLRSLFVHSYFFYKSHFEDPFYRLV